jgi:LmbE family N-acetylglucosaminyl deacetylase
VAERDAEIAKVASLIGFSTVVNLRLPTTHLDELSMADLIARFSVVFNEFAPEEVFVAHWSDVHTDHRVVFDAAAACTKWFRNPSVRRVLAYETVSETEFGLDPNEGFRPNYFVDISGFLESKLGVMSIYQSEMGECPFPRSPEVIRALATWRGSTAGFVAAEAFELLRERS